MIRESKENSLLIRSFKVLCKKDRRKLIQIASIQVSLNLLDLMGVGIIGVLSSVAVNGVIFSKPGNRVSGILEFLGLENLTVQQQGMILGVTATALMVSKTLLALYFMRRTLYFLGNRAATISEVMVTKLLSKPLQNFRQQSLQTNLYITTTGVNSLTIGVIGTSILIISDFALLVLMVAALAAVDPLLALCSLIIFGGVGLGLYKFMHVKAGQLGRELVKKSIKLNSRIFEVFRGYREAVVMNRREYYATSIGKERLSISRISAELTYLPTVSKYGIEITVILGLLLISASQFLTKSASQSVAILTIFIAASSRIAPAVLRIQQGLVLLRSELGSVEPVLELLETIDSNPALPKSPVNLSTNHQGFNPRIEIANIKLEYDKNSEPVLQNIDLTIEPGQLVAIVGPSGAGKTSLVDVILGIVEPTHGTIQISDQKPLQVYETFPGAVAYVPQEVLVIDGTIRENVTLGFPDSAASDLEVLEALKLSQLSNFISALPEGIFTQVGDGGSKLSGGQKQRIGIARALLSKPKLLILDEATSSLDGSTEAAFSSAVEGLKGAVTVVVVAHRLSTIRNMDRVVYLQNGEIIADGTFDEVRSQVQEFDIQATQMGL